jgi:hypothetical protein
MLPVRKYPPLRAAVPDRVGLWRALRPVPHLAYLMMRISGLMQESPTLVEIPRASVPR